MPSSIKFMYLTFERWSCMDQDRHLFQTRSQQFCWQPCSDDKFHYASNDSGMWPYLWLWHEESEKARLHDNVIYIKWHHCVLLYKNILRPEVATEIQSDCMHICEYTLLLLLIFFTCKPGLLWRPGYCFLYLRCCACNYWYILTGIRSYIALPWCGASGKRWSTETEVRKWEE